jgi:ABC-type lipoprotein release transport system permease subunit
MAITNKCIANYVSMAFIIPASREFDKLFVLVDIRHIQRLNNWSQDQIGGYEVFIDDPEKIAAIEPIVG